MAISLNGVSKPISKDPITDSGKRSKAGKLHLSPSMRTSVVPEGAVVKGPNLLEPVFRNGEVLRRQSIDDIRQILEGRT